MTTDEKRTGKLKGRIALVTGGTSGIGLATAKRFVAEGAYVFITGRREKELASAVKSIGERVTGVQGDVYVNVKGLLFTVQKALPLLKDGASIVLCASVVASKGLPSNSVYSATKAAVRSFARTWATDLRSRRIRVNAVSPGSTDTPGLCELLGSSETGQQRLKMISNVVPLGRLGKPDEIANAVVFLASDDASYITGAELFVDGGFAQI